MVTKKEIEEWKIVTKDTPKPGAECLFYGLAHGDYGYTEDEHRVMRGVAVEPVTEEGKIYPSVRILEATPRYWSGFTPLRYKEI